VCRWTENSFSVWRNRQLPILMINVVAETKANTKAEGKIHVEVHSHSVNTGQRGNIDWGVERSKT